MKGRELIVAVFSEDDGRITKVMADDPAQLAPGTIFLLKTCGEMAEFAEARPALLAAIDAFGVGRPDAGVTIFRPGAPKS